MDLLGRGRNFISPSPRSRSAKQLWGKLYLLKGAACVNIH